MGMQRTSATHVCSTDFTLDFAFFRTDLASVSFVCAAESDAAFDEFSVSEAGVPGGA